MAKSDESTDVPLDEIDPEEDALDQRDDETPEEKIVRERGEYLAHWQRARADYQNLRRRMHSDIENAVRNAKQSLLEELLIVMDNFEVALTTECKTDEGKNVLVGLQMVRDMMTASLERENVKAIPTDGKFDPALHQAVATVKSDDHEPGAIVRTIRRGYTSGDTVLRFAQVEVAAARHDSDDVDAEAEADA